MNNQNIEEIYKSFFPKLEAQFKSIEYRIPISKKEYLSIAKETIWKMTKKDVTTSQIMNQIYQKLKDYRNQPHSFKETNSSFSLQEYCQQIEQNYFTIEEERAYIQKIQKGDKIAKREFVQKYLKYVIYVAKNYIVSGIEMDDLVAEGNLGLYDALNHYDETKGRFTTYARPYIQKRICRLIQSSFLSQQVILEINSYQKKLKILEISLNRSITINERAEYMSLPVATIERYEFIWNMLIEKTLKCQDSDDPTFDSYYLIYKTFQLKENIAKIIEKLPPNYQEVIKIRYMGSRKLKFQEVADKLGTSRQNIQQIEARALKRIRKMPEAAILEEYL